MSAKSAMRQQEVRQADLIRAASRDFQPAMEHLVTPSSLIKKTPPNRNREFRAEQSAAHPQISALMGTKGRSVVRYA
jgi:hypothetical protein